MAVCTVLVKWKETGWRGWREQDHAAASFCKHTTSFLTWLFLHTSHTNSSSNLEFVCKVCSWRKSHRGQYFQGSKFAAAVERFVALRTSSGHRNPSDGFCPPAAALVHLNWQYKTPAPKQGCVLVIRGEHLCKGLSAAQTWGSGSPVRKGARGLEPAG